MTEDTEIRPALSPEQWQAERDTRGITLRDAVSDVDVTVKFRAQNNAPYLLIEKFSFWIALERDQGYAIAALLPPE